MKPRILRKNKCIRVSRPDKKRRSKITSKIVEQVLRLKAKEKLFESFFEEFLSPGYECPVLLETFTMEEPPYKLSSCEHRLTATVLRRLRIKDITNKLGSACMICPVCRSLVLFAYLDNSYLQAVQTMKKIKEIENAELSEIIKTMRNARLQERRLPLLYFNPTGGILDLWEQICSR